MRVNVNLDEELLPLIDEEAKRLHISRSAYLCVCCSSETNVYGRQFDQERAFQDFISRFEEQDSNARIMGKIFDSKPESTDKE